MIRKSRRFTNDSWFENSLRISALAICLPVGVLSTAWVSANQPAGQESVAQATALGISTSEPKEGPFVKLADGTFMVPYVQTIEQTDIRFEMIPIPGGEVVVGSPESEPGRGADEGPQFTVVVEPFWMAKTELTWTEYKTFLKTYDIFKRLSRQGVRKASGLAQADAITVPTPLYEPSHTYEHGDDPRQPAVTMTQYAAKQYCKWLSGISTIEYRLPMETEWEYAARAGTKTVYSFGDNPADLDQYAAFADNSPEGAPKVGSKKPNPFGLYDMHGSVWEWTVDHHSSEGYGERAGKKLTVQEAFDPPKQKDSRTVRGGGWQDPPDRLRSAARLGSADEDWKDYDPNVPKSPWWYTTDPSRMVGMRLVRSHKPLSEPEKKIHWEIDNDDTREDVDFRLQEGRGAIGIPVPELTEEFKRKR